MQRPQEDKVSISGLNEIGELSSINANSLACFECYGEKFRVSIPIAISNSLNASDYGINRVTTTSTNTEPVLISLGHGYTHHAFVGNMADMKKIFDHLHDTLGLKTTFTGIGKNWEAQNSTALASGMEADKVFEKKEREQSEAEKAGSAARNDDTRSGYRR